MRIIEEPVTLDELKRMARAGFGDMVKAVVDIERGIVAVDGELHADEEALLMEGGSRQNDLWGRGALSGTGPSRVQEQETHRRNV